MKNLLSFFISLTICVTSVCQNEIGLPDIVSYSQEKTKSGAQTWYISQDGQGIMYFANNAGLLTFNGKEWKLYPLPNKTIVRSLRISPDGKIFVGGQDEFGYFFPDKTGQLTFTSLLPKFPGQKRKFGDVWKILLKGDFLYLRTTQTIFIIRLSDWNITIKEVAEGGRWAFMELSGEKLYLQNGLDHLLTLKENKLEKINAPLFEKYYIIACLSFPKDTTLFVTQRNGLFLWNGGKATELKVDKEIKGNQIYAACKIDNNTIALATLANGVYFINRNGTVVRHFSTQNGLQQNNIRSLFKDHQQNLWVGTDEGIDLINYSSPFCEVRPKPNTSISSYTSLFYKDKLYIGTSEGLFATKSALNGNKDLGFEKSVFEKISNSDGQVWSLTAFSDHLLMGHHDGTYIVSPERATLLDNQNGGTWLFKAVPDKNVLLSGTYNGFRLYLPDKGTFIQEKLNGEQIGESLRFIEIDVEKKTIWASHPYRGVYKINLSDDFRAIVSKQLLGVNEGLPSNSNNFVYKINKVIVFATQNGIYEYNYQKKRFLRYVVYDKLLANLGVRFITSDNTGKIWFATAKQVGVVEGGQLHFLPELEERLIAGFENIYPFNDQNIFFGSYKSLIHFNYTEYKKRYNNISVLLNKVIATKKNDSAIFNGYFTVQGKVLTEQDVSDIPKLAPGTQSLHFEFGNTQYGNDERALYSYRLKGLEDSWSEWSQKNEKDYTNLNHGTYTFLVRAKDNLGNISKTAIYSFKILPHWYETTIAWILYALIFLLLLYGAHILQRNRLQRQKRIYEKKQAHLKYVHKLELEHNQTEIIQLKNEKLEAEMLHKNKELATTTMHLYKRGRLLGKIKEELSAGMGKLSTKDDKNAIKGLLKLVVEEEKQDQDWEQFSIYFDQVHNNFLRDIKQLYPELTPGDLKICAYLKINLSSKEIAQLLNISLKGVEIGRYRLRKKLGIDQDINLHNFINTIG